MPAAIVVGAGTFGASLADRLAGRGLGGHARPPLRTGRSAGRVRRGDAPPALLARRRRALYAPCPSRPRALAGARRRCWWSRAWPGWRRREGLGGGQRARAAGRGRAGGAAGPGGRAALLPGLRSRGTPPRSPRARGRGAAGGRGRSRRLAARAVDGGARLEVGEARPEGRGCAWARARSRRDAVVWACGAWLAGLFPDLVSLRVTLQQVVLFRAGTDSPVPAGWTSRARWYGHGAITPRVQGRPDGTVREVDPDARPARRATTPSGGPGNTSPFASRTSPGRPARGAGLPLQPHRGLELHLRAAPRGRRASGSSAAARDTGSSTGRPWPSTWRPCSAAVPDM